MPAQEGELERQLAGASPEDGHEEVGLFEVCLDLLEEFHGGSARVPDPCHRRVSAAPQREREQALAYEVLGRCPTAGAASARTFR